MVAPKGSIPRKKVVGINQAGHQPRPKNRLHKRHHWLHQHFLQEFLQHKIQNLWLDKMMTKHLSWLQPRLHRWIGTTLLLTLT